MNEKFFKIDMLLEQVDTKRITKTRLIKIVNEIQSLMYVVWHINYDNSMIESYFSLRGMFYMIYGETIPNSTPKRIKWFMLNTFKLFYIAFKCQVTKINNGMYRYIR